ncbi:collagen alpha-2(I) chain-like [Eublepharis macularius]|uniref:Collagen alpha-2(I) chain-like n=1 Tax=Eublepharis macularius TaxID=481883 RepID=A0AA97IUW8_EUBMA|nr:collagen alpha-2(I) chain-like [Eublepharis macularius]
MGWTQPLSRKRCGPGGPAAASAGPAQRGLARAAVEAPTGGPFGVAAWQQQARAAPTGPLAGPFGAAAGAGCPAAAVRGCGNSHPRPWLRPAEGSLLPCGGIGRAAWPLHARARHGCGWLGLQPSTRRGALHGALHGGRAWPRPGRRLSRAGGAGPGLSLKPRGSLSGRWHGESRPATSHAGAPVAGLHPWPLAHGGPVPVAAQGGLPACGQSWAGALPGHRPGIRRGCIRRGGLLFSSGTHERAGMASKGADTVRCHAVLTRQCPSERGRRRAARPPPIGARAASAGRRSGRQGTSRKRRQTAQSPRVVAFPGSTATVLCGSKRCGPSSVQGTLGGRPSPGHRCFSGTGPLRQSAQLLRGLQHAPGPGGLITIGAALAADGAAWRQVPGHARQAQQLWPRGRCPRQAFLDGRTRQHAADRLARRAFSACAGGKFPGGSAKGKSSTRGRSSALFWVSPGPGEAPVGAALAGPGEGADRRVPLAGVTRCQEKPAKYAVTIGLWEAVSSQRWCRQLTPRVPSARQAKEGGHAPLRRSERRGHTRNKTAQPEGDTQQRDYTWGQPDSLGGLQAINSGGMGGACQGRGVKAQASRGESPLQRVDARRQRLIRCCRDDMGPGGQVRHPRRDSPSCSGTPLGSSGGDGGSRARGRGGPDRRRQGQGAAAGPQKQVDQCGRLWSRARTAAPRQRSSLGHSRDVTGWLPLSLGGGSQRLRISCVGLQVATDGPNFRGAGHAGRVGGQERMGKQAGRMAGPPRLTPGNYRGIPLAGDGASTPRTGGLGRHLSAAADPPKGWGPLPGAPKFLGKERGVKAMPWGRAVAVATVEAFGAILERAPKDMAPPLAHPSWPEGAIERGGSR